jgi:hypothetical protein
MSENGSEIDNTSDLQHHGSNASEFDNTSD